MKKSAVQNCVAELVKALKDAREVALTFDQLDDGGASNFDAPALNFTSMGIRQKDAELAIKEAGLFSFEWKPFRDYRGDDGKMVRHPKYLVINGFQRGQGFRRTVMSEAFKRNMVEAGYPITMYYQMD